MQRGDGRWLYASGVPLLAALALLAPALPAAATAPATAPEVSVRSREGCGDLGVSCESRFRVGLGAGLLFRFTEGTESSGDIARSSLGISFELSVAPSYRISDSLALGLRLGWAPELGERGLASSAGAFTPLGRTLWDAAADVRFQPVSARGVYLSIHGGAAAMVDRAGEAVITQWGPLLGAAVGCDWRLARPVSLALELQGNYAGFSTRGERLQQDGQETVYQYGATGWFGLVLIGTLGL